MADQAEQMKKDLMTANRLMDVQNFTEALDVLQNLIELQVAVYGDPMDPRLGETYLAYGKCLFQEAKQEATEVFTEMMKRRLNNEDIVDSEGEPFWKEKTTTYTKTIAKESNDPKTDKMEEEEDNEGEEEIEAQETFEVAWEWLETARLLFSKRSDPLLLSYSYHLLGELGTETQNLEQAIADLQQSLALRKQIKAPNDITCCETYYQLGLAHQLSNNDKAAQEPFKIALDIAKSLMAELGKQAGDDVATKMMRLKELAQLISIKQEEVAVIDENKLPDVNIQQSNQNSSTTKPVRNLGVFGAASKSSTT